MSPDSGIFGYEQECQCDHLRFIQKFFSILVDNTDIVRSVLVELFVAFDPDAESTLKKLGRFRVLFF
jgi:hypothetical protein